MIDPSTIVTRTARDRLGHRVYIGGSLIGRVEQFRTTGPTGRACTRWRAAAAAMAFLAPGNPLVGVPQRLYRPALEHPWLPGEHVTKAAAIDELVAYLIVNQAPAVGYGPHPDVAAAPASPRVAR